MHNYHSVSNRHRLVLSSLSLPALIVNAILRLQGYVRADDKRLLAGSLAGWLQGLPCILLSLCVTFCRGYIFKTETQPNSKMKELGQGWIVHVPDAVQLMKIVVNN